MFLIKKSFYSIFLNGIPIVILFFLVFTGFDLSIATVEFVSFNFVYIILFFYILKKPESLGYGLIFFSGIVNDIVLGLPIGISSIDFLILSGIASYFRNLTLRPSLILDWMAFFPSILIVNSMHYYIIKIIFEMDLSYFFLIMNCVFTFLAYPIFAILINIFNLKKLRDQNV